MIQFTMPIHFKTSQTQISGFQITTSKKNNPFLEHPLLPPRSPVPLNSLQPIPTAAVFDQKAGPSRERKRAMTKMFLWQCPSCPCHSILFLYDPLSLLYSFFIAGLLHRERLVVFHGISFWSSLLFFSLSVVYFLLSLFFSFLLFSFSCRWRDVQKCLETLIVSRRHRRCRWHALARAVTTQSARGTG